MRSSSESKSVPDGAELGLEWRPLSKHEAALGRGCALPAEMPSWELFLSKK